MSAVFEKVKEEGRVEVIAEGRVEGRIEGRIEGRVEERISIISLIKDLNQGKITEVEVAKKLEISEEEVLKMLGKK